MFDNLFPVNWEAFHFLRPHFLWLFLLLAIGLLLGLLTLRQEIQWKKMIAPHLRPYVISKGSERVKVWMYGILFLSLSFGIVGMAGPAWKKIELPGQELETPLVILLDLSQSMMADDLQPTRLERAKFKINDLLNHNPQASAALIGFAGTAHTIVPLTKDYEIIFSHIDGLSPSVMPFPGSDLEAALVLADSVMSVTSAPGTLLILTDDINEPQFALLRDYVGSSPNKVEILPMNTDFGSDVPVIRGNETLKDAAGKVVHSALNQEVLKELASLEKVTVHALTLDDSDVEMISKSISDNLMFTEKPEEKKDDWRDAGLLFVVPFAIMLLFWFRKGWVLYVVSSMLLSSCSEATQFADLWYTHDFQGQKLSNKGDFTEAANRYDDPMRKGVAYFKSGNYEEAVQAFHEDTTARGNYNLGLTYFQMGDTAAALLAFGKAIEMDPQLEQAQKNVQELSKMTAGMEELDPDEAEEAGPEGSAENTENDSNEDLGGGGQEATEEDMKKERQEETVATDVRKGKELEEVPDDIGATIQPDNSKVLMRKVDDDPTLFLKRKFAFQVKTRNIKPKQNEKNW